MTVVFFVDIIVFLCVVGAETMEDFLARP